MPHASQKNVILTNWEELRTVRANQSAIFSAAGTCERTFGDIEREAEEWQEVLENFAPGSVIVLQFPNHPAWPAVMIAAFRCGLIPLPLAVDAREEAYQFCGASLRIHPNEKGLRVERLDGTPVAWPNERPDFIKLTSGTTSQPRAVLFSAKQLWVDCQNICRTMGLGAGDLNYGVIPFSHSYGFSNLITPLICEGIPLVWSADPFPRAILQGLESTQATVLPGVPALFAALAKMENARLPKSLRLCISAGAMLSGETSEAFREKFGIPIHSFYGSSECGGICYDREGRSITGFVGEAMDGVEVEASEVVRVKSEAVAMGYFPPDEFLKDGVFQTADLLERQENGWQIVGRASDFINIGGRKVNPNHIEECLRQMPGLDDCAVFGIEREANGAICAIAVANHDAEAIRKHCAQHLPAWQVPKQVFLEKEIPRNARGKISRVSLANYYRNLL